MNSNPAPWDSINNNLVPYQNVGQNQFVPQQHNPNQQFVPQQHYVYQQQYVPQPQYDYQTQQRFIPPQQPYLSQSLPLYGAKTKKTRRGQRRSQNPYQSQVQAEGRRQSDNDLFSEWKAFQDKFKNLPTDSIIPSTKELNENDVLSELKALKSKVKSLEESLVLSTEDQVGGQLTTPQSVPSTENPAVGLPSQIETQMKSMEAKVEKLMEMVEKEFSEPLEDAIVKPSPRPWYRRFL